MKTTRTRYGILPGKIGSVIEAGKSNALSALNNYLLLTYWNIGKYIVEFEQEGKKKAAYGDELLSKLSTDLKLKFGKGFSKSNVYLMRLFYLKFPIFPTSGKTLSNRTKKIQTSGKSSSSLLTADQTSTKLTWSHYSELLSVSDDNARQFYEVQCVKDNWSVRELKRQIGSSLFQRLALSKDKKGLLLLASKGHDVAHSSDLLKEPYIFEFLNIQGSKRLTERGLEKKLIDNLQTFLLELGKGFSFVARQFRITLDNKHFYIDLVFYHRILKCFVLIDLKINKVQHKNIGQMNLYLNYFREEENTAGDNEPIGIIIATDKHEYLVKYATGGLSNKIFVSKYQLYLPDKKMLEQKVKEILEGK